MGLNDYADVFLTDGRDGDFSSSGGAQSERTHGKCGGGIDCTDQLTALRCMDTLDCLFPAWDDPFLFTLYLFCNKRNLF